MPDPSNLGLLGIFVLDKQLSNLHPEKLCLFYCLKIHKNCSLNIKFMSVYSFLILPPKSVDIIWPQIAL